MGAIIDAAYDVISVTIYWQGETAEFPIPAKYGG